MARIAIIGGHGKVALNLAPMLSSRGHEVSALFRNPEHSEEIARTGASPVVADVENLSTEQLTELLRGHDAVVWSAGAGGGNPERTAAVDRDAAIRSMDAAAAAGARRYVMVSYFGASVDHNVPADHAMFPYAEAKAAADEHLRTSDLDWTIVAPSTLTLDPGTSKIDVNPAEGAQVSREDVARVIAGVLERPATAGHMIQFNSGTMPIGAALDSVAKG